MIALSFFTGMCAATFGLGFALFNQPELRWPHWTGGCLMVLGGTPIAIFALMRIGAFIF